MIVCIIIYSTGMDSYFSGESHTGTVYMVPKVGAKLFYLRRHALISTLMAHQL